MPDRKEERFELENLVVLGKRLRRRSTYSAETRDEELQRTGRQPIAVSHLQHDFGVTNEMDQELQHFLISRTEGRSSGGCPWS